MFQICCKILKPVFKVILTFAIFWAIFQYSILRVTIVVRRVCDHLNHTIPPTVSLVNNLDVVNILIWSHHDQDFDSLQTGQDSFIKSKCENINCYVTRDRNMLGDDYSLFDAVLISAKDAVDLPGRRSPHQKYVFATRDLDVHRPVCEKVFENYFNLTFTPKRDSDAVWSYFPIVTGYKVAANADGKSKLFPLNAKSVKRNGSRVYAAIYIDDNCQQAPGAIIQNVQSELKRFYLDLKVVCAEDCFKTTDCTEELSKYYFQLVLEEPENPRRMVSRTLEAIHHSTVPVIIGPTDYSR